MNAGDNVEFQVGDNYQAGSPVGVQVDVTTVPQAPLLQWALGTAANGTQVTLNFNEPLDPVSSTNTNNYSIPGVSVTGARFNIDDTAQVILTVSPGIVPNTLPLITVNGVKAGYGLVPVAANTSAVVTYQTSWDAFNDFYFEPASVVNSGGSWTGKTNLNPTWLYVGDNVNGIGAPFKVGTYGNGNWFALNAGNAFAGTAHYTATGPGEYFAYCTDIQGWGEQVGIYNYGWETNAPGYGLTNNTRLWLEAGNLGSPNAEGIAGAVVWTAPYSGTFKFTGSFLPASSGTPGTSGSTVDVAIADDVGGVQGIPFPSTILTWGNAATNFPAFTLQLNGGDRVEWQVGDNQQAGSPVGVQADVALIQPPTLVLTINGANVVLSWPTSASGFTLESTSSLAIPWAPVSTGVVVNGLNNTVTVPLSHSGDEFFRLEQ
jgi:hypothetical protein